MSAVVNSQRDIQSCRKINVDILVVKIYDNNVVEL